MWDHFAMLLVGAALIQVKYRMLDGVVYVYDADSEVFLAQGKTVDEIRSVLKLRFPDKLFLVPLDEFSNDNADRA